MDTKRPPSAYWVQRVLTPYLRYAFSHELAWDDDISPKVHAAIEFCMRKPDHSSDGDRLLFERICHAVEFRCKDLEPDLRLVTDDLENMARWLIRYAQVNGSCELLGRMNIGSGAWQACEAARLEGLKMEAKKEQDNRKFMAPPPLPKAAPSEDQIDPRLVLAMPGQYVDSNLDGKLQVHVDQYFREQIRRAREPRPRQPPAPPSWVKQIQQADGVNQPHLYINQNTGRGWVPQQQQPQQAPSYIQQLGQRQSPYVPQGHGRSGNNVFNMPASGRSSTATMSHNVHATSGATHLSGGHLQNNTPTNPQAHSPHIPPQQRTQQFPVQPPAAPNTQPPASRADIPMGDLSHLRGKDWSNAAEQRAREFRLQGVSGMNLHQHQSQLPSNGGPPVSMYQVSRPPTQPSPSATIPSNNGATAPAPDHIVIPHTEDVEMQDRPQAGESGFMNHPGFSNVTNSFQNWQYGAPTNPGLGQNRRM